jgi:ribulose-phosphate 3-epimerase
MIDDPDRWAPAYAEAGAGSVTFHAEACAAPVRLARSLRSAGARAGIALSPATPRRALRRPAARDGHAARHDRRAWVRGQSFLDVVLPKLRRARAAIAGGDLDVWLQVDGGISADTVERCAEAGRGRVRGRVSRVRRDDPAKAVEALRAQVAPLVAVTRARARPRLRGDLSPAVTRAPGQVRFLTGGDSPRPARSQPAVDPVELRDRR